jgi:membrane protease YdiL (CAAX protease family)
MTEFDTFNSQTQRPFLAKVLIIVGLALIFMFIGSAIGIGLFILTTGMPLAKATQFQQHLTEYPNTYLGVMILQTFSAPLPFIATALYYWRYLEKQTVASLSFRRVNIPVLGVVALLVIGFMGFDALIIEWNQQIRFPSAIQKILEESEKSAAVMTKFFTLFKSPWQFGLAIFVVAILAGVSEELLFRGVLQNIILKTFGNPHVAVWASAFTFSFIHFQFFGFVPRMLLGALFGYLYYWTNNLSIAMFAHFVNNGFTLLMAYLYQMKMVNADIEKTDSVPLSVALISLLFTAFIMRWFWVNSVVDNNNSELS